MEKMQHEESATWKKCKMEKVQLEKVQHGKSATWKKCSMKIVEVQPEPHEYLRWRTFQQCLMALVIIAANLLDVCGDSCNTSGNIAK